MTLRRSIFYRYRYAFLYLAVIELAFFFSRHPFFHTPQRYGVAFVATIVFIVLTLPMVEVAADLQRYFAVKFEPNVDYATQFWPLFISSQVSILIMFLILTAITEVLLFFVTVSDSAAHWKK